MVFVQVTTAKNPDTGRTETTKSESNFFGVKTSPKSDEVQAGLYASDTVLVLAAGGSIPRPSTVDEIQFNGHKWGVESIATVAPAEQDILYKMAVRDKGTI